MAPHPLRNSQAISSQGALADPSGDAEGFPAKVDAGAAGGGVRRDVEVECIQMTHACNKVLETSGHGHLEASATNRHEKLTSAGTRHTVT